MGAVLQLLSLLFFIAPLWAQDGGWQKEWSDVLARAKQEGKVTVLAPPDPDTRVKLPAKFKDRFGIEMEYLAGSFGRGGASKVLMERRAGLYQIDVVLGGVDSVATVTFPENAHDPLRPLLILPEVLDSSKWKEGKLWFMDPPQQYVLRLFNNLTTILGVNTAMVKPDEIQSFKDILHPRWRGKLSVYDAGISGKGAGFAAYLLDIFGEEFVRRLYMSQQPVASRDDRQIADWLARGTYPIAVGPSPDYVERLRKDGLPVAALTEMPGIKAKTNGAEGFVMLMNRPPHPNAAKVFVNWIASRDGLEAYARSQLAVPLRSDIDESYLPRWRIPRPGTSYWDSSSWEYNITRKQILLDRVRALMKERAR